MSASPEECNSCVTVGTARSATELQEPVFAGRVGGWAGKAGGHYMKG